MDAMDRTTRRRSATAFGPATVANVAAGFDVLGFALSAVGDRVTVTRDDGDPVVRVTAISGVVPDLPHDATKNTAAVALAALIAARRLDHGFSIELHKGIPLGSGMGGSAASAVAAVVAAQALVDTPLDEAELLACALAGEAVASGAPHADNAAPCLHGGLTVVVSHEPPLVVPLPVPERIVCVLVHPHLRIDTRDARAALPREVSLGDHVAQSMHLAGFVCACFRSDLALLRRSMVDLIAEPARSHLIPGYAEARAAALEHGAIGCSIAGSGPSVFAWVEGEPSARAVE
jgi:homoserine kinase